MILWLLLLFVGTGRCPPLDVKTEINTCPPVQDFRPFFQRVPDLGRKLRVACPCVGVHACGYALEIVGVPTDAVNVFDLEDITRSMLSWDGLPPW